MSEQIETELKQLELQAVTIAMPKLMDALRRRGEQVRELVGKHLAWIDIAMEKYDNEILAILRGEK